MSKRPAAPELPVAEGRNAALLSSFETHLATRPAHTRDAYLRDLNQLAALAGDTPLPSLTRAQLARFLATLHGRGLSGRSLARMLSAWRAFHRFLADVDNSRGDDPSLGLKAPKSPKKLPSALTPDEAVRLVEGEGVNVLDKRDHALFELAYSSGLRLAELTGLDVDRVDLATGEVRVWGKGSKERVVPVGAAALAALEGWLAERATIRGADDNALFVGANGRRIAPRQIQRRLAALAVKRGINRHVHPHMLRHSFASHVLQSSGDLRAVQEMLGHASIASTQVYTHLDFQALAKVYDAAHPRARKKK
ncbi:MAG TPA: tyrosine recombinase XerC [Casimicrobiaceae bacterium]|nr:tyrosine recombinase XerC [Casimicrobiaceae bacterium]